MSAEKPEYYYEQLKEPWSSGLNHLERLLQSMGATEEKQARLTEVLRDFEDFTDRLRDILHNHEAGLSSLEGFETRVNEKMGVLQGCIELLHQAHMSHMNYSPVEFKEMHGFMPGDGDSLVTAEHEPLEKRLLRLGYELEDTINLLLAHDPPESWTYHAIEFVIERLAKVSNVEVQ